MMENIKYDLPLCVPERVSRRLLMETPVCY